MDENSATENAKSETSKTAIFDVKKFHRGSTLVCLIAACIFVAATLGFFLYMVIRGAYIELGWFTILLLNCALVPGIVYFERLFCAKKGVKAPKLRAPLLAMTFDLLIAVVLCSDSVFALLVFLLPIGTLAAGVTALASRKEIGKTGMGIAIGSLAAPVIAVIVFIILLSTRVVIITWM